MARLTQAELFSRTLPDSWAPALQALEAFVAKVEDKADEARPARVAELRERLHAAVKLAAADALPATLRATSPEHRRAFSEAVLAWLELGGAGGRILLDTFGSVPLARFPVDLEATGEIRARFAAALERAFAWTPAELAAIEARLAGLWSNLRIKRAIAGWAAQALAGGTGEQVLGLLRRLFAAVPHRADDVSVVVTDTSIFFCVPSLAELGSAAFADRTGEERAALLEFATQMEAEAANVLNIRFPAFGMFRVGSIDPALTDELAEAVSARLGTRVDPRVVLETLATMVTLLPRADADMYLVHDAWGHSWQETLGEFEWLYQPLARPPDVLDTLVPAFRAEAGRTVLDADALGRALTGELATRLSVAMNFVVSEALADLVEHKMTREGFPLATSSLLPAAPFKFDLTVGDVRRVLRRTRRPYLAFSKDDGDGGARLRAALLASGLPDEGLDAAIAAARAQIRAVVSELFDESLAVVPAEAGQIETSVFQRFLLAMATLEVAVGEYLSVGVARSQAHAARVGPSPRWHTPSASIDLLVVMLGWFFEQDRAVGFWHLDELLTQDLAATVLRFEDALRSELDRG